jgi:hypothetical protein
MMKHPLRSPFTWFGRMQILDRMRRAWEKLLPDSAVGAYMPDSKVASMKEGAGIPSSFLFF